MRGRERRQNEEEGNTEGKKNGVRRRLEKRVCNERKGEKEDGGGREW